MPLASIGIEAASARMNSSQDGRRSAGGNIRSSQANNRRSNDGPSTVAQAVVRPAPDPDIPIQGGFDCALAIGEEVVFFPTA